MYIYICVYTEATTTHHNKLPANSKGYGMEQRGEEGWEKHIEGRGSSRGG